MNIKQHIEAGHYPKTENGMEIVQTSEGLTVHIADVHPDGRIAGWLSKGDVSAYTWNAHGGAFQERGGDLLPPPPRKVKRSLWAAYARDTGRLLATEHSREQLGRFHPSSVHFVELTGEYEEPWS